MLSLLEDLVRMKKVETTNVDVASVIFPILLFIPISKPNMRANNLKALSKPATAQYQKEPKAKSKNKL